MLLEIPKEEKVYDLPSSTVWFDGSGILYSVSKPQSRERTIEEIHDETQKLRDIIGNRKVCIIVESAGRNQVIPKEQRDAIAEEMKSVTRALAIISPSPLSRMVANLFFSFRPPLYPMKLFSQPEEAREWIAQYL